MVKEMTLELKKSINKLAMYAIKSYLISTVDLAKTLLETHGNIPESDKKDSLERLEKNTETIIKLIDKLTDE